MRKLVMEESEDNRPVYLYDSTLPAEERCYKRRWFRSGAEAGKFLGVDPANIYKRMSAGNNITSKIDFKKYTVRPAPEQEIMFKLKFTSQEDMIKALARAVHIMNNHKHWSDLWDEHHGPVYLERKKFWDKRRDDFLESLQCHGEQVDESAISVKIVKAG